MDVLKAGRITVIFTRSVYKYNINASSRLAFISLKRVQYLFLRRQEIDHVGELLNVSIH